MQNESFIGSHANGVSNGTNFRTSGRQESKPFVAPSKPRDSRQSSQNHPRFAEHLTFEKRQASKRQYEENDAVDDQADYAARGYSQHQPFFLQWCVNQKISSLGNEKGDRRGDNEMPGRENRREYRSPENAKDGDHDTEAPLNEIPQDEGQPHYQDAAWRHDPRRHGDEAGPGRHTCRPDIQNEPVCNRNA